MTSPEGNIVVVWDYDEPFMPWYDLAHKASIEAGIALPEHEPTSWAPHETYGCSLEEWVYVLDQEVLKGEGGMYAHPLDPNVLKQTMRLDAVGVEQHIATARGSFGTLTDHVKRLTLEQVAREDLPIKSVNFVGHDKAGFLNAIGADYFLDDSPKNYLDAVEHTHADVYLLDERWNQDLIVPETHRLHSIDEFVDIVLCDVRLLTNA